MPTKTTEAEKTVVSVQMTWRDVERLRTLARASERSLSAELRVAVAEHLAAGESEKRQP
jgi:hypothetical protein